MTERDDALSMIDELGRLLERSDAASIEVETPAYSVKVTRRPAPRAERPAGLEREAVAEPEKVQRVRATTVGIFSAAQDWQKGDAVKKGAVLGAIQSLGHMADITSPADGRIDEVLVAAGAPVEYGQPLFAISLAAN
jgi:acetyl-CoA carboxylase biotin carboxyl carrier protein